jgi:hypothetical protein
MHFDDNYIYTCPCIGLEDQEAVKDILIPLLCPRRASRSCARKSLAASAGLSFISPRLELDAICGLRATPNK